MPYLAGKAVVVTGAGRGLGRAYAHLAAQEGASVVVNDIHADVAEAVTAEIVRDGGQAVTAVADVSDWAAAEALIGRCVTEFGAIHGLVNNAGLFSMADGWELGQAHVDELVRTNIVGVMACGTFALRRMVPQGFGSIVNITSGAHLGMLHMSVYGATKGAVASLTYTWSMEAGSSGVRVNAVSPLAHPAVREPVLEDKWTVARHRPGLRRNPRALHRAARRGPAER
jgi:NAD(P)-dependent dehydrogenase (short-subunit alcohol dehydrogenase family)